MWSIAQMVVTAAMIAALYQFGLVPFLEQIDSTLAFVGHNLMGGR